MTTNNLKATVYARLEAIAAAEKITRVELAALSREALMYVPESNDIDLVNRLLGVLTPMNRETAIQFFRHFLPWEVEETKDGEFSRFGKRMKKEKQVKRRMDAITEFLADEANTIWTWAGENLEVNKVEVNGMEDLGKAVEIALKGRDTKTKHAEPITKQQVVDVVLGKIGLEDLMAAMMVVQARIDAVKAIEEAANKPVQGPDQEVEAVAA